jgi:uncharacterized protein
MSQDLREPLSEDELDRLEALLDARPEAMNLEMLDGFFVALACSPELVPPSASLPVILGEAEPELASLDDAMATHGLLMRYWNTVVGLLETHDPYDPILLAEADDDQPTGTDWAVGFLEGVSMGGEAWKELFLDEERGELLLPIFILAHEHDPDPEMRPDPIDAEHRLELFAGLSAFVPEIHRYFEPHRRAGSLPPERRPVRRCGPKIGRNDPCPCGSGKKYKQCCGRDADGSEPDAR